MRLVLASCMLVAALVTFFTSTAMATSCNMITSQKDFDARHDGPSVLTMNKQPDNGKVKGLNDIYTGTLASNHAPYYFTAHHGSHEGTFQVSVGLTAGEWSDHPKTTILRASYDNKDAITVVIPPRVKDQLYNCDITDDAFKGHHITSVEVFDAKW